MAIRFHQFGDADVLRYEDAPVPKPGPDEILIRVEAAAVNPVDAKIRAGRFRGESNFPMIPGFDVAGTVEATGEKVTTFKKGEPVYVYLSLDQGGGYAQFAVAKASSTARKPAALTYEEAAAVPLAGSTAWEALVEIAKLQSGQTILIHGGSGGVGSFAVQIARALGAKVIATGSAAHQQFLKKLGADQTIDYRATKFEQVAKDVDVVLDTVGGDTLERSYDVVKKGGIIVSIVQPPDPAKLAAHGIRGTVFLVKPSGTVLNELTKLIEAKKLKPEVSAVYPLAEAAKAQKAIETRHTRGKIVLRVGNKP